VDKFNTKPLLLLYILLAIMDFQTLQDYCLSLPFTEEGFPFDNDTMVFKVVGKMFALTSLKNWEEGQPRINLKCEPTKALELREQYEGIQPGYHMSKTHWNTVTINQDVNDKLLKSLIKDSYDLVFGSLSKKVRTELMDNG
jgi:predicted DNA-binding protein (MmcQ/YjbR family)